jgi:eukaryotic-like serine/threonine-protein kinase
MASVAFRCPHCSAVLSLPEEVVGKRIKCRKCQQIIPVAGTTKPAKPGVVPGRPAVDKTRDFSNPNDESRLEQGGDDEDSDDSPPNLDFLRPAQAGDELGRLGNFRILRELGRGGMGVVFLAEDLKLGRQVALKVMLPQHAARSRSKDRFLREARAAASIENDHIITILQVDEDNGVPFLAMPVLKGEPLNDRLRREKRLPIAEVVRIAREICAGLEAAHERKLIHRDLKPGNLWIESPRGRVKILDFGLARPVQTDEHLTRSGAIVGTPSYMAPEQARSENVDFRADLFSLGVIVYQMLVGQLPFKGHDPLSTMFAICSNPAEPPSKFVPDLPAELESLVMKLLAKDPAERFDSAQATAAELEAIQRNHFGGSERTFERQAGVATTMQGEEPNPFAFRSKSTKLVSLESSSEIDRPALPATKAQPPKRPTSRMWLWTLLGAGFMGFVVLVLAAQVVIRIRDEKGKPIADVTLPKGGTVVEVDKDGKETPIKPGTGAPKPKDSSPAMDPDRKAVETLLRYCEKLDLRLRSGETITIRPGEKQPGDPFAVVGIFTISDWRNLPKKFAGDILIPAIAELRSLEVLDGQINTGIHMLPENLKELVKTPAANSIARLFLHNLLHRDNLPYLKQFTKLSDLGSSAQEIGDSELVELAKLPLSKVTLFQLQPGHNRGLAAVCKMPLKELGLWDYDYHREGVLCVDGELCRSFAAMPYLEALDLGNSDTRDDVLHELARCKKLDTLTLSGTRITDTGLDSLKNIKTLKTLQIGGTAVSAPAAKRFAESLPQCRIVGKGFTIEPKQAGDPRPMPTPSFPNADSERKAAVTLLQYCNKLELRLGSGETIEIGREQKLPGEPFAVVGIFPISDRSKLPKKFVGDILLPAVAELRSLEVLSHDLNREFDFHPENLKELAKTPAVNSITRLHFNRLLHRDNLPYLKRFTKLSELGSDAQEIGDSELVELAKLPLSKVTLFQLRPGQHRGLAAVCKMPLKTLELFDYHAAGVVCVDADLCRSIAAMPYLEALQLPASDTSGDLLSELARCKKLATLNLGATGITDAGLDSLKSIKTLKTLLIRNTTVSAAAAKKLAESLPLCRIVGKGFTIEPKQAGDSRPIPVAEVIDPWPQFDRAPLPAWELPKGAPKPALAPFDAKQAKQHQKEWAAYLKKPEVLKNSIGMKLALIPPGEFDLGNLKPIQDPKYSKRRIRLTDGYYLSTTAVTYGQFKKFVDETGYKTYAETTGKGVVGVFADWNQNYPEYNWKKPGPKDPSPDHPVVAMTMADASAFCRWLSKKEKATYRLPTEAEWENACRAGSTSPRGVCDEKDDVWKYAWGFPQRGDPLWSKEPPFHPVALKLSNAFGLFDMLGNVNAYCEDNLFPGTPPSPLLTNSNPWGPHSSIHRGGSSFQGADAMYPDGRTRWGHAGRNPSNGFRVLRQIDETNSKPFLSPLAPVLVKAGEPLSEDALVQRPTPIKGLRSWTVQPYPATGGYLVRPPKTGPFATHKNDLIALWKENAELDKILLGRTGIVQFHYPKPLDISPDGKRVAAVASNSRTLQIWDTATGACLRSWTPFDFPLAYLSFAPDSQSILVRPREDWNVRRIIDLADGSVEEVPSFGARHHSFSPKGDKIAFGTDDAIFVVDRATGVVRESKVPQKWLKGEHAQNSGIAWSPDGSRIATYLSSQKEGVVLVWNAAKLDSPKEFVFGPSIASDGAEFGAVRWSRKSDRLLVFVSDNKDWHAEILNPEADDPSNRVRIAGTGGLDFADWADDDRFIVGTHGGGFWWADAKTGQNVPRTPVRYARGYSWGILGDPKKESLAVSADGTLKTFDIADGSLQETKAWKYPGSIVAAPQGQFLRIVGNDKLLIADRQLKTPPREIAGFGDIKESAWSPDGELLAGVSGNRVLIVRASNGVLLQTFGDGAAAVRALAWSPDGKKLAISDDDLRLQVWDPLTGKALKTVQGAEEKIKWNQGLSWSADGKTVLWTYAYAIQSFDLESEKLARFGGVSGSWMDSTGDGKHHLLGAQFGDVIAFGDDWSRRKLIGVSGASSRRFLADNRRVVFQDWNNFLTGYDAETGKRLGTLIPGLTDKHWICIGPSGHYAGSVGVEEHFVYVAMTDVGHQEIYPPAEFARRYGWKNDPAKARFLALDP